MKRLAALLLLSCFAFGADDNLASALRATSLLRAKMVDPDSLVVEHVYAKPGSKTMLCIPYRSKNGFGGYSHGVAEYKGGDDIAPNAAGWCFGIERNLKKALNKGWVDLTDEYLKAAKEH